MIELTLMVLCLLSVQVSPCHHQTSDNSSTSIWSKIQGIWKGSNPYPVDCPELQWKPFDKFVNHRDPPGCWDAVLPSYRVHFRGGETCDIGDEQSHLFNIRTCPNSYGNISKLVIIIHGANQDAGISSWPYQMAEDIFAADSTPGLVVITVDWEKGADSGFVSINYGKSAANTRYVGIATERIVKQLLDNSVYIHCIGFSLGAHICGFLGDALKKDINIHMDRITGLDPAGFMFTTDGALEPDPYDILSNVDERLDKSDATLVDVIHSDGDSLGTMVPHGHVDFYVGPSTFGSDQFDCLNANCDHKLARELMTSSISDPGGCWATYQCQGPGENDTPDEHTLVDCQIGSQPHFGYFYDGNDKGIFGAQVTDSKCNTPFPLLFTPIEENEAFNTFIKNTLHVLQFSVYYRPF